MASSTASAASATTGDPCPLSPEDTAAVLKSIGIIHGLEINARSGHEGFTGPEKVKYLEGIIGRVLALAYVSSGSGALQWNKQGVIHRMVEDQFYDPVLVRIFQECLNEQDSSDAAKLCK